MGRKSNYEIEQDITKNLRFKINSVGMRSLTNAQEQLLDDTYDVLSDFVQEYSEMFDVTSETARKLQTVYWSYINEFNKGE
jgi:hypothetical protein|tara:strand:+ start:229 stop:471 length:243 start_codon:yes stop_codon:yes gene_type:complete